MRFLTGLETEAIELPPYGWERMNKTKRRPPAPLGAGGQLYRGGRGVINTCQGRERAREAWAP